MAVVFINYRRDQTAGEARALFKELAALLGNDSVFMDVDTIALGRDFRQVIRERLESCDLMLVMIGRDWVDARNASGQRRLEDPRDFVRLEVEAALKRNIPVTPVLVQGAQMPTVEQLADSIKDLAYRNGFELSHNRWESDVKEMVKRLGISEQGPMQANRRILTPRSAIPDESSPTESNKTLVRRPSEPTARRRPMFTIVSASVVAIVLVTGGILYYRSVTEKNAKIEQALAESLKAKSDAEAAVRAAAAEAERERAAAQAERERAAAQAAAAKAERERAAAQAAAAERERAAAQAERERAAAQAAAAKAERERAAAQAAAAERARAAAVAKAEKEHPVPPPRSPGIPYEAVTETQVRNGPGVQYPVIANIAKGTKFRVVAQENGWLKLETRSGNPVYVAARTARQALVQDQSGNWSAFATNARGQWGFGVHRASHDLASRLAIAGCGGTGQGCKVFWTTSDRCVSYAESRAGGYWYAAGGGASEAQARQNAIRFCQSGTAPPNSCRITGAWCR